MVLFCLAAPAFASDYASGQLIIKLKDGTTLEDIRELNGKYNVVSAEKVFKETPFTPQEVLNQLKDKLFGLNVEHQAWYWQIDKSSAEYQEYLQRIEKEREALQKQIQEQEEFINKLEQRQKRAPEAITPPDLEKIYLLKAKEGAPVPLMAVDYGRHPAVQYAEPNYIMKAQMVPNDPYYSSSGSWGQGYADMWGLKMIQPESAWDISQGNGVVVAVVDSGVDYNHEDISANIWANSVEMPGNGVDDDANGYIDDVRGWDFVGSDRDNPVWDNDPMDGYGHGTHVGGIIAASGNNSKGIIGVAPSARLMPVKGLDNTGWGYNSTLAICLKYAADNGADIINASWIGTGRSLFLVEAVNYALSKGCVIVVCAGNNNDDVSVYTPASYLSVITVAATDSNDQRPSFSNYGYKIDLSAPGGDDPAADFTVNKQARNILSLRAANTDSYGDGLCIVGSNYYRNRGTSFSTAFVSGAAALLFGKNSGYTVNDIKRLLFIGADDRGDAGWDKYYGFGRLNAYKALTADIGSYILSRIFIDSTIAPETIFGKSLEIMGTAVSDAFSSYTVDVGAGTAPTTWLTTGITLNNSGTAQVFEGILGNWDSASFADGLYTLRLKVFNTSGLYKENRAQVVVNNSIRSGWPQIVSSTAPADSSGPVTADVDNDGKLEVIVTTPEGLIYVWRHDGTLMPGWPVFIGESVLSAAVGDLDGDGYKEIVAGKKKCFYFSLRWPALFKCLAEGAASDK